MSQDIGDTRRVIGDRGVRSMLSHVKGTTGDHCPAHRRSDGLRGGRPVRGTPLLGVPPQGRVQREGTNASKAVVRVTSPLPSRIRFSGLVRHAFECQRNQEHDNQRIKITAERMAEPGLVKSITLSVPNCG